MKCGHIVRVLIVSAMSATVGAVVPIAGHAGERSADVEQPDAESRETVRMARATWDTGWFQAEVYRQLLEELGYTVESVTTMENEAFYASAAAGEVDLWVNGWFPLHDALLQELGVSEDLEVVGTQVDSGAQQGYLVDAASAEEAGIDDLADLRDPALAARFDADDDGLADLVGCTPGWGCEAVVEEHLDDLGLRDTVEHVQGDYAPLIDEVISRHDAGEPVLFYTWTPNWTVGELAPGDDVVWIGPSWPDNDIRTVANGRFLDANPEVRRLLDAVTIPLADISQQNARMRSGEGAPEDIRRHAREWIAENTGQVETWLRAADADYEPDETASGSPDTETGRGDGAGSLVVTTRSVSPFVTYEDGQYTGFSIELWKHIARRLGVEYEIQNVNSLAKQIDDIQRGTADVAVGGLDITATRANDLALSQPTFHSGLQIMVVQDTDGGVAATLGRIVSSRLAAWIFWFVAVFGVIVLVVGHVIWVLERDRNPDIPNSYPRGIAEALWWAVVAITPFGAGNNTPKRNLGRVFAVGWILAGYFLLAYFTATITSTMAVDEIRGEIAGPEDLGSHRVGTVAGTAGGEQLAAMGVAPVLYETLEETYDALGDGEIDAVVYDAPVLQHNAARSGEGGVAVVGPVFNEFSYGLGASHDTDLRDRIDVALLELMESGVYDTVYQRWFGAAGSS